MNRLCILGFLALTVVASAQTRTEGHRIVTKTRLQVVFSDLENQWLEAIKGKNSAALDNVLSENFEVWTPNKGEPIPIEEWKKEAFSRLLQSFQISQLAVRAVSDQVSVASFVLSQKINAAGKTRTENEFVVDVWIKDGESWRCTDRYVSAIPSIKATTGDARPTGKQ